MLPSIFGENLFDSFFSEPFGLFERQANRELYGKHAAAVMRTDVREASRGLGDVYKRQGQCSRSFYVGEGITDADVHAKFEDGILRLSIPKAEQKALPEKTYIAIE